MSMKNSSETIGNRTRNLPGCSTIPQPTGPLRVPLLNGAYTNFKSQNIYLYILSLFSKVFALNCIDVWLTVCWTDRPCNVYNQTEHSASIFTAQFCADFYSLKMEIAGVSGVANRLNRFTSLKLLTLSLLMSYIYGAPCKVRNFNVVYIWTYVWQRWKPSLSICCKMFQHWINAEIYPVAQLCVNTLPATKFTLITDGI
jgi:hypothetical protein